MNSKDRNREGHRERLRKRFLQTGLDSFYDYEIIELLLTLGTPRKDCKNEAKKLLAQYKTIRGVLEAGPDELKKINGIGANNIFGIKFAQAIAERLLKEKTLRKSVVKSSKEVYAYLSLSMRGLKREIFKVIFLDKRKHILGIENLFEGTIDASAIYPREIIEQALKYHAAALIFVHNHPTGNPAPSTNDKRLTKYLVSIGLLMQIEVEDHIIIGDGKYYSFADKGLIEKYERQSKLPL